MSFCIRTTYWSLKWLYIMLFSKISTRQHCQFLSVSTMSFIMTSFCSNFTRKVQLSFISSQSTVTTNFVCPNYLSLQYIKGNSWVAHWLAHWLSHWLVHWLTGWISYQTTDPIMKIFGMCNTFWSGKLLNMLFIKNSKSGNTAHNSYFQLCHWLLARFHSDFP